MEGPRSGQRPATAPPTTLVEHLRGAQVELARRDSRVREAEDQSKEAKLKVQALEERIRVLEGEVSAARLEISLAAAAAPTASLGFWEDLLAAGPAKARWLAEIERARGFVRVMAFTYDLADISEALTAARRRKLVVEVALDRGNSLKCVNARPVLQQMMAYGVQVRVVSGRPLQEAYVHAGPGRLAGLFGILHAKVLWTEQALMIGSCNFTTASQANVELVAVLKANDAGAKRMLETFAAVWDVGSPYNEAAAEGAGRPRAAAAGGPG